MSEIKWKTISDFEKWWNTTKCSINENSINSIIQAFESNPNLFELFEEQVNNLEKTGRYNYVQGMGLVPIKPTWGDYMSNIMGDVAFSWQGDKPLPFYSKLYFAIKGNYQINNM